MVSVSTVAQGDRSSGIEADLDTGFDGDGRYRRIPDLYIARDDIGRARKGSGLGIGNNAANVGAGK